MWNQRPSCLCRHGPPDVILKYSGKIVAKVYLIVLGVLFFGLAGCGGGGEVDEAPAVEGVRVEDFEYSLLPGGARILSGKLYNPSDEPIRNAQIQVSLFDPNNRRVSTMQILVQDIGPGEHKPFRESLDTEMDIRGARVRSILVL